MLRALKSILVAGCVFTTVINGVVIYDAINSIAHAGEIINNYDADGNLIGHSEIVHETDAQALARVTADMHRMERQTDCMLEAARRGVAINCF